MRNAAVLIYVHSYWPIGMTTTVQVDDETRRLLERLKSEKKLSSYDQVIRWLVAMEAGLPSSMFGAAKGSRRFERGSEDEHQP